MFAMCERQGMMELKTYLTSTGTSQAAFAERVGISASFLSEILNGPKEPGPEMAQKIEAATNGAVPMSAWPRLAKLIAMTRGAV